MTLLHGLTAPAGDGIVLEVHLDIQKLPEDFAQKLTRLTFEDDPFEVFFPEGYEHHFTSRTRVSKKGGLQQLLPQVRGLVDEIIIDAQAAGVKLYAEIELVRSQTYFTDTSMNPEAGMLEGFLFSPSGKFGAAKADIHVEFEKGTVSTATREYLLSKRFYWVSTPATPRFPPEEIATLQTSYFPDAMDVFEILSSNPPRNCTGIHLEQKLLMAASAPGIGLPEVTNVVFA